MVRTARVTGALAALIWLVGTPVVAIASVPFPSDAEYLLMGLLATLLGLTLTPVVLASFYERHRPPHFAIRPACMGITASLADGRRVRHVAGTSI